MDEPSSADVRNGNDERILLVLHGAMHKRGPINVMIGDIVLTDRSICFVRYLDFEYFGTLGKGAALLVAGLPGVIATSVIDGDKLNNARDSATVARSKLFGTSLAERITAYTKSLVYAADSIGKLQVSEETLLSIELRDGNQIDFLIPPLAIGELAVIGDWPKAASYYETTGDPDGLCFERASPRELLSRVENGDSSATLELFRLGEIEQYAEALYFELQSKSRTERQNIFRALTDGSQMFRKNIHAMAKSEGESGSVEAIFGLMFAIVAVVLGWYMLPFGEMSALGVVVVFSLMSGFIAFPGLKKVLRAMEVARFIE